MFSYCNIKNKICPMATKDTYDPVEKTYLWKEYTYCGAMTGCSDTRVDNLDTCWLDMKKGQRTKHNKRINEIIKIERGNETNRKKYNKEIQSTIS